MKRALTMLLAALLWTMAAQAAEINYRENGVTIVIERGRYKETNYVAARVEIENASQIRTALAGNRFGDKEAAKAATIAKRVGAVLAVNGDDFGLRDRSFTWRNGKKYRENPENGRDVMILDERGDMHFMLNVSKKSLKEKPYEGVIREGFSFGPALVVDGVRQTGFRDMGYGAKRHAQRMCFAQTGPLKYLCLTTEGPEDPGSEGLTLEEFAEFVSSFPDVQQAYNLDGGTTATLVYRGEKINAPKNPKTRWVNDIIYFAPLDHQ